MYFNMISSLTRSSWTFSFFSRSVPVNSKYKLAIKRRRVQLTHDRCFSDNWMFKCLKLHDFHTDFAAVNVFFFFFPHFLIKGGRAAPGM